MCRRGSKKSEQITISYEHAVVHKLGERLAICESIEKWKWSRVSSLHPLLSSTVFIVHGARVFAQGLRAGISRHFKLACNSCNLAWPLSALEVDVLCPMTAHAVYCRTCFFAGIVAERQKAKRSPSQTPRGCEMSVGWVI
jgi:late competence protein required for DNA uptake (superfamily II DNA/RNA helicase)